MANKVKKFILTLLGIMVIGHGQGDIANDNYTLARAKAVTAARADAHRKAIMAGYMRIKIVNVDYDVDTGKALVVADAY